MSNARNVRGTRDIYGNDGSLYDHLINSYTKIVKNCNFQAMYTPIFELEHVFNGVGTTSDIVTKEMYTFHSKGGEALALRPEGTAAIIRSIITNGLTQSMPFKCYYHGPMFRYERPQKGRYRQFHQAGLEILGTNSSLADLEAIIIADLWLKALNLDDKVTLRINSLGDQESRDNYRKVLLKFLQNHKNDLSDDSLARMDKNPLRILDSKDKNDQKIIKNAPIYKDYLNQGSTDAFTTICQMLKSCNINFIEDYSLVRGLDYYQHTVFEFTLNEDEKTAVLAGGRYYGVAKQLGAKTDIPGVGWAAGLDRLILLLNDFKVDNCKKISFIALGDRATIAAANFITKLRSKGLVIDLIYEGNLKKQLKKASTQDHQFALILGHDELDSDTIILKDMHCSKQTTLQLNVDTVYNAICDNEQ